jgi:hypothetical protein
MFEVNGHSDQPSARIRSRIGRLDAAETSLLKLREFHRERAEGESGKPGAQTKTT